MIELASKARVEEEILACYPKLYRLAYVYLKNRDDAMDAVQESVCKAIASAHQLRDPSAVHSWLCGIVVRTATDMLRARSRETVAESLPEEGREDVYQDGDALDALARLERRERTVVALRVFGDLPLRDVAAATGENVNTVKTLLYRSLKKLRADLTQGGDGYGG